MKFFKISALSIAMSASIMSCAAVTASTTVTNKSYEDIADSAHWQSNTSNKSLLIAALEEDGLAVFNEQGKQVQHIESNEMVGVDVRYGIISESGENIDIAAVVLADDNAFAFYRIDESSKKPLNKIGQFNVSIKLEGVCLAKNLTTGALYVNGFSDEGDWVQFKLNYDGKEITSALQEKGKALPVRQTKVGGKLSTCVVDDGTSTLYLAEQDIGVWQYGADPEDVKERSLLDVAKPLGHFTEVESIDIAYQKNGKGLIIIADEGEGFLLYDRSSKAYLNKFSIDGVEEAKLVTVSNNGLWIGNTELEQPIYQTLSFSELANLGLNNIAGYSNEDKWINNSALNTSNISLVKASAETEAVNKSGDAADDPALWFDKEHPEKSLVIATNKKGGLLAYDLKGTEIQFIKGNEVNNVDIRQDIKGADGHYYDIAAASNRELNTIALYTISNKLAKKPINVLEVIGEHRHPEAPELATDISKIYGLCMGQSADGIPYVYVNGKSGEIEQWRINVNNGKATGDLVRKLKVATQPEGCVVDDKTQTLYVGEEDVAIWSFDARENGSTAASLFVAIDDENIVADIEGVTLYQTEEESFLLASIQGSNTYAVFDLNDGGKYLQNFAVIGDDSKGVDGASDTDGIHATSLNLGPDYPKGVFLAQDWYNLSDKYQPLNQNFKIVDWRDINMVLKK